MRRCVSDGRVYLGSDSNLYAIGKKSATPSATEATTPTPAASSEVAHVQVVPTELMLKPGATAKFRVRLFDSRGLLIREEPASAATWSVENLKGTVTNGELSLTSEAVAQAGRVKATVGGVSGGASVRVFPPLPWSENFDAGCEHYSGNVVKLHQKIHHREMDGNKFWSKTTPKARRC